MELYKTYAAEPPAAVFPVPQTEVRTLHLRDDPEVHAEKRTAGHAPRVNVPTLSDHVADCLALASSVGNRNSVGIPAAHIALY